MAMSLNRVMIIGNMTRDPELKTLTSGQAVASFGVATNRVYNDKNNQRQEEVEFHNIVAWGKLAEICSQYLGRGRKVYVEGRLRTREWEGQDGLKRKSTEIIADNVIMLDRPGSGSNQGQSSAHSTKVAHDGTKTQYTPAGQMAAPDLPTISIDEAGAPAGGFKVEDEVKIEDIPF